MTEMKYLTISQIAKETGWSKGTIRRWIDSGVLPARRRVSGNRVFITVEHTAVEALKNFVDSINDLMRYWGGNNQEARQ